MVQLSALFEDLEKMNVNVFLDNYYFDAVVIEESSFYSLCANPFAFKDVAEFKFMLAHECGHTATNTTHKVYSPFQLVRKNEYRANKYAFFRYMPPEEFEKAIAGGCRERWEFAEWFGLPEDKVMKAHTYYKANGLL